MTFYDFSVLCMVVNPEGFETGNFFNFLQKYQEKLKNLLLPRMLGLISKRVAKVRKIFKIGLFVRKCSQISENSVRLEIDKRKHVRKFQKFGMFKDFVCWNFCRMFEELSCRQDFTKSLKMSLRWGFNLSSPPEASPLSCTPRKQTSCQIVNLTSVYE